MDVLRSEATDAEILLWSRLRNKQLHGVKFRRQEPFQRYILDFVSYRPRLVIEVDGGQHMEAVQSEHDLIRSRLIEAEGFRVLRFWNCDVLQNLDAVLEEISRVIRELHPHLASPIEGEGYHAPIPTRQQRF